MLSCLAGCMCVGPVGVVRAVRRSGRHDLNFYFPMHCNRTATRPTVGCRPLSSCWTLHGVCGGARWVRGPISSTRNTLLLTHAPRARKHPPPSQALRRPQWPYAAEAALFGPRLLLLRASRSSVPPWLQPPALLPVASPATPLAFPFLALQSSVGSTPLTRYLEALDRAVTKELVSRRQLEAN